MKYFVIGFLIGAIISPITGNYFSGFLKELTGKTTEEIGFQAGKYTRERILRLPPIDYE